MAAQIQCSWTDVDNDRLPGIIVSHAETIFKTNHEELTSDLDSKSVPTLKNTRGAMLNRFAEICPSYPAKNAHNRSTRSTDKHTLVQDILILGSCIIAKAPVSEMHLVYNVPEQIPADQQKAIEKLFQISETMSLRLKSVEEENVTLKSEKEALANRIAILEAQIADQNAVTNDQIIPSEPTDDVNDIPDDSDDNVEQPQNEPRPVRGATRTSDVFIGTVEAPCSAYDIQNHIKKNTSVTPKITDIRELKVRGDNKAFKVTVPQNKIKEVISKSVWDSTITVERYDPNRPKKFIQPRGAKNNKIPNRNEAFRNSNRRPHSTYQPSYPNDAGYSPSRNQQYRDKYSRNQYPSQYRA